MFVMTDATHFLLAMNYRFTYFRFRSLLKTFKENTRKLMLYITLYYSNFCSSFYMTTAVRTVFVFPSTRSISWPWSCLWPPFCIHQSRSRFYYYYHRYYYYHDNYYHHYYHCKYYYYCCSSSYYYLLLLTTNY